MEVTEKVDVYHILLLRKHFIFITLTKWQNSL
jgi:hypothetical protein